MAQTPQEFIQSSFSPIIATLCSSKVENIVSKNNLSFCELLQPFTCLDWEGQFREPGGSVCTVKNWKLIVRDVSWKPLQPTEARRQLNNAVLHNYDDKTITLDLEGHKFDVPHSTPWFEAWTETYFEVQFPSDHEFTKHFLSCIIVATTLDDNIVDTYNSLNQQYAQYQNVTPPKLPKWFNNGVLKSYLLLHDVSLVSKEKADASFDTLKQTFGAANCFMLAINSKSPIDIKVNDFWAPIIKRAPDTNSDISSSLTNLSTSPVDSQVTFNPPNIFISDEKQNTITSSVQHEGSHPLTTNENEVYDNANSLQTHSFSGSSESVYATGRALDNLTEVHGAALNNNDIEAIKRFLQEYASKALLPHLEKQIGQLTEMVANRKGVSRSLLSATKRWFTTGKSGSTTINNAVIYNTDCPELQLRRLGDLWFICGQWQKAFDAYHTAKREFYADSAWLCYAGALEMAAISAFMAGEANRKTYSYMEESIVTYLNTCRMIQYAVRATLLSAPCLVSSGLYGEAAKQLIRMTSEDSDLRSAMLLEQAAMCFLQGPGTKAMCRKYAFHMVLAGHRFSKAGQKKHAYRCYKQAYQVYAESGWRLATDHVQFALGRLAGALRLPRDAAHWLAAPLAPASHHHRHQQDAFLREFMLAHQQWVESSEEFRERLGALAVPLALRAGTAVSCAGVAPLGAPGRRAAAAPPRAPDDAHWRRLEEAVLHVARAAPPMIFKPTCDVYTAANDAHPVVPQGEPIQISIVLRNPLKVSLLLKDIEILWQFVPNVEDMDAMKDKVLNNEPLLAAGQTVESDLITSQKIKTFVLEGDCQKTLTFSIISLKTGQLNIHGLAYKLNNVAEDNDTEGGVTISGKIDLLAGADPPDKRLQIHVIPHAPCLQMTFSETNTNVISGELRTVDVEFRNVGPVALKNLHLAVSHPECMCIVNPEEKEENFKILYDEKYREQLTSQEERGGGRAAAAAARRARRLLAGAAPGACSRAALLLRPHARAPALYLLAYYETGVRERPYRLLRHVFRFKVTEAIEVVATPRRGLAVAGGDVIENLRLAVEVKNICNEKEEDVSVEVLEASLLSRQWKFVDLTAAIDGNDRLISRERVHYIFKAKRMTEEVPDERVEYSSLKLSKDDPESAVDVNVPPYSKFVTDFSPSIMDSIETNAENAEKRNTGLIRSMFVLRWKAYDKLNDTTAIGQHCVWLECFTRVISREREQLTTDPSSIQIEDFGKAKLHDIKEKNEKSNAVILKFEHSKNIDHNFKTRKLCLIPIVINIVNCYNVPVKVYIDITKQQNRESSSELGWAGALSCRLNGESKELGLNVSLEKFETRRVQVRALCAAPGTYPVGAAFTVTTTWGPDNQATTHFTNNTSLLVVKQVA
ncbi:trafficking protein particle complex subunit 8 [Epargyreus clarus]|uniref:trafficking protein particle complex subunit 8 n=1 Tax=Epargyreus clarus TaxID=520877 RepID=UPI003C2F1BEE